MRVKLLIPFGIAAVALVLLGAACGKTYDSETASVTLDAGTELQVAPLTNLSPVTEEAGDEFTATLAAPLIIGEQVVAARGTTVMGEVIDAYAAAPGEAGSFLSLELKEIMVAGGQTIAIETAPVRYAPSEQASPENEAAPPAVVPEETVMTFRLAEPVEVPLTAATDEAKPEPIS
jgi:hypothetical protein